MGDVDELVKSGFGGRQLVACQDGPRAGAWYFLDNWRERRRIAIEVDHENPESGAVLGYVATTTMRPHPRNSGVEGRVLVWDPVAATAEMRLKR